VIQASRGLLSGARVAALCALAVVPAAARALAVAPPPEATGAQTALEEGMWLLGREEYAAAVEAFKRSNREGGGHCGECLLGLAKALERLDRVEPAIAAVREAIAALDGSALSGTAYVDLGQLLLGRQGPGDLEEGDRAFTRALQILAGRTHRAAALSGMAMVRLRQKRYVDAVEAGREALDASTSGPVERQARIAVCLARDAGLVPGPVSAGPWRR
jgi:tetratricopeptide (TPR) repeat protein